MKKPLVAFSLLLVAACAKNTTSGPTSRNIVDSNGVNRQLKNDFQDLSGAFDAITLKSQQLSDLCDDYPERVAAFNDALAARQVGLGTLMDQKDDIKNLLRPVRDQYRQAVLDEGKSKGIIAANLRLISYYSKPASVKDFIRVDKKQLGRDKNAEQRKLRAALKAENNAEYGSDAYDRADADEQTARGNLASIEAQLKQLSGPAQTQSNTNAQILKDQNVAEDVKLRDAQARKSSADISVGVFKGQLKAKLIEIAQYPKIDNLSPLDPTVCDTP